MAKGHETWGYFDFIYYENFYLSTSIKFMKQIYAKKHYKWGHNVMISQFASEHWLISMLMYLMTVN